MKKVIRLILVVLGLLSGGEKMSGQVLYDVFVDNNAAICCASEVTVTVYSLSDIDVMLNNTQPSYIQSGIDLNSFIHHFPNLCAGDYEIEISQIGVESIFTSAVVTGAGSTPIVISTNPTPAGCVPGDYLGLVVTGGSSPYEITVTNNGVPATLTSLVSGNVFLYITDATGCSASMQAYIPDAYMQPPISLFACQGGTVTYGGVSYSPGLYYSVPTGGVAPDGCDSTVSSLNVLESASWQYQITAVPNDCQSSFLHVTGANNVVAVNWSALAGEIISTSVDTVLVSIPGTYHASVATAEGCGVAVGNIDLLTGGNNVVINQLGACGTAIEAVSSGIGPFTYLWSTGETTQSITTQQLGVGTYVVTVTDAAGCSGVQYTVTVSPLHFECFCPLGCAGYVAKFWSDNGNAYLLDDQLVWSNGTDTFTGSLINVPTSGTYTVTATDMLGCSMVVSEELSAMPQVSLFHCDDQLVLMLNGDTGPYNISWSDLDAGACTVCFVTDFPTLSSGGTIGLDIQFTNNTTGATGCSEPMILAEFIPDSCPVIIQGYVHYNDDNDCVYNGSEVPRPQAIVTATNTTTGDIYYGYASAAGLYQIPVPNGVYTVVMSNPSILESLCAPSYSIDATSTGQFVQDIPVNRLLSCPMLTVDMGTWALRRCFPTIVTVSYSNQGTADAADASIVVTLDPLVSILFSNLAYTNNGDGTYTFEVGDVAQWQTGSFLFEVFTSCEAILGQTLCTEAHIYPDDICAPSGTNWDGSQVSITGFCDGDSVRFEVQNIGSGDMSPPPLEYYVIEDQIILFTAPFSLTAGTGLAIELPANGSTWRVESAQVPSFPYPSMPSAQVEGCGTTGGGTFSTGFVNWFPLDDWEGFVDQDCYPVIGAYDPNYKQGMPVGYDAPHYITPETPLEYTIHFQNTGTDTAFLVVIRDTLPETLDITSFQMGASSHACHVDLVGKGELVFTFDPIALPDSFVNEPASNGFVNFRILPKADAPLGTEIRNSAAIYFDFNEAVVTDRTLHTLGREFVVVSVTDAQTATWSVSPNPTTGLICLQTDPSYGGQYQVVVSDLLGRNLITDFIEGYQTTLDLGQLPRGLYTIKLSNAQGIASTVKVLIK